MMKLIDVHCHLDKHFFSEDELQIAMKKAQEDDVIIVPAGVDPITNRYALELHEKFPDRVFPTLGIYPPDALETEKDTSGHDVETDIDVEEEIRFIKGNKDKIIGIGEIGMDAKNGKDLEMQEAVFRKMIELAIELDMPVVVHSRKAEEKVIDILESYDYGKIIMHCFGGKQKHIRRIRENQWYFSIPTSIVRDEHFQRIVKETPMHLLLTETDSPFLSPYRDEKNIPSNVKETIKIISNLKRLPELDVQTLIMRNAKRVFNL